MVLNDISYKWAKKWAFLLTGIDELSTVLEHSSTDTK